MEQQTPIPRKSGMKPREGQKRAIFPSLILGGGGGGLGFPFILSKIIVYLYVIRIIIVLDTSPYYLPRLAPLFCR